MAKLHSGSPREITSPFTCEIISVLHSKACNNLSLVPRPSYHGVPVRGPGNSGLRTRLIKTASYA